MRFSARDGAEAWEQWSTTALWRLLSSAFSITRGFNLLRCKNKVHTDKTKLFQHCVHEGCATAFCLHAQIYSEWFISFISYYPLIKNASARRAFIIYFSWHLQLYVVTVLSGSPAKPMLDVPAAPRSFIQLLLLPYRFYLLYSFPLSKSTFSAQKWT